MGLEKICDAVRTALGLLTGGLRNDRNLDLSDPSSTLPRDHRPAPIVISRDGPVPSELTFDDAGRFINERWPEIRMILDKNNLTPGSVGIACRGVTDQNGVEVLSFTIRWSRNHSDQLPLNSAAIEELNRAVAPFKIFPECFDIHLLSSDDAREAA